MDRAAITAAVLLRFPAITCQRVEVKPLTCALSVAGLALIAMSFPTRCEAQLPGGVRSLVEQGEFAQAEELLRQTIDDPDGPVVGDAATELEILRRTRIDYSLDREAALEQVRRALPGTTEQDFDRWTESGALHHRVIDGRLRYFRKAPGNLFRLSEEASQRRREHRGRQTNRPRPAGRELFSMTEHVRSLVAQAEETDETRIHPLRHRIRYALWVEPGHPRVKPGAEVRAWLAYPQAYQQQGEPRLISSTPEVKEIAPNGSPHRTVYFEQTIGEDGEPPRFEVEYEYTISAVCSKLDPTDVQPYRADDDTLVRYTSERAPHIVFTPEVKALAAEIISDEENPLVKARLIFRWVSDNIPWIGEREYGTIRSLSQKGLTARCGDCGVQGMVFVTLCRAAGVPARWQSGWELRPGAWGMHDWSEMYLEPWGWLPVDASYGVRKDDDPRVRDFFCGSMDPYRLIANLDYARPLVPEKTSFRSEPNDFQRGEIEIDGHNLYFDEWRYSIEVESSRIE